MVNITFTNETFTSINGTTVRYSELFAGIQSQVAHLVTEGYLSWDEADDAVLDAAYKACRCAGRYDENRLSNVRAYGAMIARSVVFNKVRGGCILEEEEVEGESYDQRASKPRVRYVKRQAEWNDKYLADRDSYQYGRGDVYDAEKDILAAEKMAALDEAMSGLSRTDRFILEMAGDGDKPADIAKKVGLTASATYSRLCRARKVVKANYYRLTA